MDELFPLLMFIIFILGPLIEGITRNRKKGQQPPTPPQRRAPPQQSSRTEEVSSRPRADEDASTMVPDELWEILTGQKRTPPTAPAPAPAPADTRAEARPSWDVVYDPELEEDEDLQEEVVAVEDVNVETRRARVEAQSLETLERHPEPIIVSLEENIPTTRARHAAFHEKVLAAHAVPIVEVRRQKAALDFSKRSELRKAFLMAEVLGKPKGLE